MCEQRLREAELLGPSSEHSPTQGYRVSRQGDPGGNELSPKGADAVGSDPFEISFLLMASGLVLSGHTAN